MKKLFLITLAILMVSGLILGGCATPAPAPAPTPAPKPEPIKLKAVSFLPTFIPDVYFTGVFAERVTERSNGELIVEWTGGPEVIAEHEQPEALRTGVIDFMATTPGMYVDLVPAGMAIMLTTMTPREERESGFNDFMDKLHRKGNMVYLGRIEANSPMYYIVTKKVEKPEDLVGLKMSTSAAFIHQMKALGISPVDSGEDYVAMERGVIDGTGGPLALFAGTSLYEVADYWIDHPIATGDIGLTMNLDSWNGLPKHLQDLIKEVMIEIEPEMMEFFEELDKESRQAMIDGGSSPIHFSPADAERYVSTARNAHWEAVKQKVDADTYAKLREFFGE